MTSDCRSTLRSPRLPTSDLLAVARPDTTASRRGSQLALPLHEGADGYALDAASSPLARRERSRTAAAVRWRCAVEPLLLWATGPMFRARSAWALSLATIPDSAPRRFRCSPTSATWWHRRLATPASSPRTIAAARRRDIRVFEYHEPLRVSLVLSKPSEYRGLFGAALTSNRVVLIASKAGQPPRDPAVISMLETYAWRCPIADARSP